MTTTFRKEFDKADVFDDIDAKFIPTYTDIDMDKVKQAVYMETTAKAKVIKFRKKVLLSLIAAVITIAALGTTAIYAYGGFDAFLAFFIGETETAPITVPDTTQITQGSDLYNITVTGITGDSSKAYFSLNLTKKDGTPITDDNYTLGNLSMNPDTWEYDCTVKVFDKDGNEITGLSPWVYYDLSSDRRSLDMIFILFARGNDLNGCTAKIESKAFGSTAVLYEIATYDTPEQFDEDRKNREAIYDEYYEQHPNMNTETGGGLTYTKQGVIYNCIVDTKKQELPFAVSFDLNFSKEGQINKTISPEQLPNFIISDAEDVQMTITSFGINFSAKCKTDALKASASETIFGLPDMDSKIVLNDGTEYYLYETEGSYEKIDGEYTIQGEVLNFESLPGIPIYNEYIWIDTSSIAEVIIDGVTVYTP